MKRAGALRRRFGWALLALAPLLAACPGVRLPSYTVKPPPRVVSPRPPRSIAFTQLRLPLERLRAAVDRVLPPVLRGERQVPAGALGQVTARWEVRRRPGVLTASPAGLRLAIQLEGEVSLAVGPVPCRGVGSLGEVVLLARPALSAGGDLVLHDPQVRFEPASTLSCLGLPLAPVLRPTLAPLALLIERGVRLLRLPVQPILRRLLEELATPRELTAAKQPLCLDLDPRALVLAPVTGEGGTLLARAGADVAPRLELGRCARRPPPPVPVVVREERLGRDYRVQVTVAVTWGELERLLREQLVGKAREVSGREVTVDRVEVGAASGRLLLRLHVHGAVRGVLYLWGTPALRREGKRLLLTVPDLQVATETASLLDRLKLSLARLWGGPLETALRSKLVVDLTPRLEELRRELSGSWEHRGASWIKRAPPAPPSKAGKPAAPTHASVVARARPLPPASLIFNSRLDAIEPGEVVSRPGVLAAHALLRGEAEIEVPR